MIGIRFLVSVGKHTVRDVMAGHSKWAQIKRSKAVKDAKKGAAFARHSREIMMAAKLGGGDPAGNFRLKTAIDHAKAIGMPNDNIARAIAKGSGNAEGGDQLEALVYEGYGPGGIAILLECLTDNRNRTAGDVRSYFNKCNGNLGADGCVAWIFKEVGLIRVLKKNDADEEAMFESAVEAGATDVEAEDGEYVIQSAPSELNQVASALTKKGIAIESAENTRIPQNSVALSDREHAKALLKLLDLLESHDDVQAVYANFEIEDALLESILQEKAAMP